MAKMRSLAALFAALLAGSSFGAISESGFSSNGPLNNDVFDVSEGAVVLRTSGIRSGFHAEAMFGAGAVSLEPGTTVFRDGQPNGYVHWIEWRTAAPVLLNAIKLYAAGDSPIYQNEREFDRFVLRAKSSPDREEFDVILIDRFFNHPYNYVDENARLLLAEATPALVAQEFRAEFTQRNAGRGFDGPRVFELDGFGEVQTSTEAVVADWTFEGGEPGTSVTGVSDFSGNGHNAIVRGSPTFVQTGPSPDEGSTSISFSGRGDAFGPEDSSEFTFLDEFTLEASINPGEGNTVAHRGVIVGQNPSTGRLVYGIDYRSEDRTADCFIVSAGGQAQWVPVVIPDDGRSHHLAGVFKDGVLRMYLDGSLAGEKEITIAPGVAPSGVTRFTVGANDYGGYAFHGIIDRVRISRRALSPAEFFVPGPAVLPVVIVDWPFEGGQIGTPSSVAEDASGRNHDAAAIGSPMFAASHPSAEGDVSVHFPSADGALGSGLGAPPHIDFNLGQAFTLEAAIQPEMENTGENRGVIVGQDAVSGSLAYGIDYRGESRQANFFIIDENGNAHSVGAAIPNDQEPHHLAGVFNQGLLAIYLDGELAAAKATTASVRLVPGAAARVTIGANDIGGFWFHGTIDRVRITKGALEPSEFFEHLTASARGIVYDNSSEFLDYSHDSSLEYGDQIELAGSGRWVTDFAFEYFASFTPTGDESARLRFYANNGELDPNGLAAPATLLYDSGSFDITSGYRTVYAEGLNLTVPDEFTWTVEFTGLDEGERAGLLLYGPPAIGESADTFWQKEEDSTWSQVAFPGIPGNFAARVTATEPPAPVFEIGTLTLQAGAALVQVEATPGQYYTLEYINAIGGSWEAIPSSTVQAESNSVILRDPDAGEGLMRFYRVRQTETL